MENVSKERDIITQKKTKITARYRLIEMKHLLGGLSVARNDRGRPREAEDGSTERTQPVYNNNNENAGENWTEAREPGG